MAAPDKAPLPDGCVLSGYTGDDRILRASTLLVINLSEGQTDLVKWAMAAARDMGCPCLPIKTTNLNGFAKASWNTQKRHNQKRKK